MFSRHCLIMKGLARHKFKVFFLIVILITMLFAVNYPTHNHVQHAEAYTYSSVCWRCHSSINSDICQRCSKCGWYICRTCGACESSCPRNPAWTPPKKKDYTWLWIVGIAAVGIVGFVIYKKKKQ